MTTKARKYPDHEVAVRRIDWFAENGFFTPGQAEIYKMASQCSETDRKYPSALIMLGVAKHCMAILESLGNEEERDGSRIEVETRRIRNILGIIPCHRGVVAHRSAVIEAFQAQETQFVETEESPQG